MESSVNGSLADCVEESKLSQTEKLTLDDLTEDLRASQLREGILPGGRGQDGSDSGVELNGGIVAEVTPAASCDSSLISFCYSSEDLVNQTLLYSDERELGDGTSEGGSESSSVTSSKPKSANTRKKCPSASLNRPSRQLQSTSRTRTTTKERSLSRTPLSSISSTKTPTSAKTPVPSLSRSLSVKTPNSDTKLTRSSSRVKSPIVPTSDGRWPSTRSQVTPKTKTKDLKTSMSVSIGPVDGKSSPLDKFATLPRRRRKSAENLVEIKSFRDPSLNRTASLRRKKTQENSTPTSSKTMPPFPVNKPKVKTKIYHETSIQTALTSLDLDVILLGGQIEDVHTRCEKKSVSVQVERRFEMAEKLEAQIKQMNEKLVRLADEKKSLEKVSNELKAERELRRKQEVRLRALVNDKCKAGEDVVDYFIRESLKTNEICKKQQHEISQLNTVCYNLKRELDKSLITQKKIIQQQREVEAESIEMQEFLQAEKSTLADTLDDLENEISDTKKLLAQKEKELAHKQDECNHLVRMSEQLRQEKLSAEARLKSLDNCSRGAMLQHGAAVSGASVALTGLGNRLQTLIEALVTSNCISEQDLEEVIYHNEAYSQSSSTGSSAPSETNSPCHKSSPARGFMSAIINAIKSATIRSSPETFPDVELLAAEPEPPSLSHFLATSSSAEEKRLSITSLPSLSDVSPSRTSHRASLAASDDLDLGDAINDSVLMNSESLQNLSQAILKRQKEEEEVGRSVPILRQPSCNLVDQVIEVDNLVTKLLRILHIIQMAQDKDRLNQETNQKSSLEQKMTTLKDEIEVLKGKLKLSESSSQQVEELQSLLEKKEKELIEMDAKFNLTQELLTNNWHKAMSEVRRQYEAIDAALEMLQAIQNDVKDNPVLTDVQRALEETNFHSASTLPVSTSQPDLNANASITSKTISGAA